ncbi:MAG: 50S ribosomal protein L4 [Candidatus Marsarchaeota archaeon]|nr:50S ribosomal protein L4 [Candidatus Marsarchaeota archaeon]MCL5111710.1 50S ribosomal protein L4 [Candidatus Marsarchaeota archaeon]
MTSAQVLNIDGSTLKSVTLPSAFSEAVRADLITRAVVAENTRTLQPQAHYVLAGMQTTARYYGAMNSYRTGRHMGIAIRPREKLGGGAQGKVKRIPSAVKGKRAHPHLVEKGIVERINAKEYQKAIRSAIAATKQPIVLSSDMESMRRTKEVIKMLNSLKLDGEIRGAKARRKGIRRSSRQRRYGRSLLIVVDADKGIAKAARNIPGVDVCSVQSISVGMFAPGGRPGRLTLWSEAALEKLDSEINNKKLS